MRRPTLLKTMVDQMIAYKAKSEQIREFHSEWAPRDSTPCPICYLEGKK